MRRGYGHEPGSGPLPAALPIVIDVWPREEMSACWADMARTFVAGQIPGPVRQQEALVREALLSPTYRNRVRNLSPRNRNSGVQHLPGSHNTQCGPIPPTNRRGQMIKKT